MFNNHLIKYLYKLFSLQNFNKFLKFPQGIWLKPLIFRTECAFFGVAMSLLYFLDYFKRFVRNYSCISAMPAILPNLCTEYQLTRAVCQSQILKSTSYRWGKKCISGHNIFHATVYCIGYLIDTGLIRGYSQTCSKPREPQKNIVVGPSMGCATPDPACAEKRHS